MSVQNSMFLFEVVIERVTNFVESRFFVIKSDFGDVFSLELKDPKSMLITIPEPPPPPPEPPGKKGKKKKKPKPKKKGKKGKKGAVELPPPEPEIHVGQSMLFCSNAEFLTQQMKKYPMEVSLWSKEENLVFIGCCRIHWDPVFLQYLSKIYNCETAPPPKVKDEYNVFQEGSSKLMAKMVIQVKLTHLTDKVLSSFRTLSEDPSVKKALYTGMNSKTTSYMCTLKTSDEEYEENLKKLSNNYIKDRPPAPGLKPLVYAEYRNIPGAKIKVSGEDTYCCMGQADKLTTTDKYKTPETTPNIDFICDYVRKTIASCNDNMRMLTPRPTIRPRIKATDIDRLCYCRETSWPQGQLAERFRRETQGGPCPICLPDDDGKLRKQDSRKILDIANIRGPCGKADCKIAREMRTYLGNILEEDNKEIVINDIIGPCGSKSCTLVDRIKDFLRHKGVFAHGGTTVAGLSTQCDCVEQMRGALVRKGSCDSVCSHECEDSESTECGGAACPYNRKKGRLKDGLPDGKTLGSDEPKVFSVYYFTVEYDNPPTQSASSSQGSSPATSKKASATSTSATSPSKSARQTTTSTPESTSKGTSLHKFKFCGTECPTKAEEEPVCSAGVCPTPGTRRTQSLKEIHCHNPQCPKQVIKTGETTPSPADSDIVIRFKDIHNPCCVKSCTVAERVKDFIAEGIVMKSKPQSCMEEKVDPCFCDCDCTFKLSARTTYCPVCGGYECIGDDVKELPEFSRPHPCPLYHKLYNKEYIQVKSPWPEEEKGKEAATRSGKSTPSKVQSQPTGQIAAASTKGPPPTAVVKPPEKKVEAAGPNTVKKKRKKQATLFPLPDEKTHVNYHAKCLTSTYNMPYVPKNMGWLWTAEDIPGLKHRPKWRPGAAHKLLVRKYKAIREGVDTIAKKRRALVKKKKIEMKPTLVVKKLDGEYTVQMEVFKKYSKERMLHQYPYDEKLPLIYTIGKTEETKYKIQKQRERRERRETRRKSRLLQSTFRDKCQEICLKAYNQSIGLLPLSNPNNPKCPCDVEAIKAPTPIIDSCSCSQSDTITSSDTDGDDWIIEFTPPMARWDAKAKHPPVLVDNECQYNYLDFKVKCLDKQGNPVPRYFKGPDGKQECSDLGGFWGPGHVWLEINKDGFISSPDNRWVPMNFIGPDGLFYSSEEGFFIDNTGATWKIGVDGYVDKDGKWAWYSKKKTKSMSSITGSPVYKKLRAKPGARYTKESRSPGQTYPCKPPRSKPCLKAGEKKPSGALQSQSPAKHGSSQQPQGAKTLSYATKAPEKSSGKKTSITKSKEAAKSPIVMNVAMMNMEQMQQRNRPEQLTITPSTMMRYNEIMQGWQCDNLTEVRRPMKANRASETVTPRFSQLCPNMIETISKRMPSLPSNSICAMYRTRIPT